MFGEKKYRLDHRAHDHLSAYLAFLYDHRDKYFGNARMVRNVVAEAIKYQNIRLADEEYVDPAAEHIITLKDVEKFKLDKSGFIFNKRGIGFGKR